MAQSNLSHHAYANQLQRLEEKIRELQNKMQDNLSKYGRLQKQLQHNEEDIGKLAKRLESLNTELTQKQETLEDLHTQQAIHLSELDAQQHNLAEQIRAAHLMGRQNYVRLWLNQENPTLVGRMLGYYDYFNRARAQQIENINQTLQEIKLLEQNIEQENSELTGLFSQQADRKKELFLTHEQRRQILADLTVTLESQDKELKRLQEDKRYLETLLNTLDKELRTLPSEQTVNFERLKGQLPYPVKGQITQQFGDKSVGQLKWQGALITANMGDKVQAVAAGRVAFAEWFRNFGLLIILDHGKGYMSLYAHNQSLYVKTGEWVEANMPIATVGNSGGREEAALYFEIRQQGVAVDPSLWLRR